MDVAALSVRVVRVRIVCVRVVLERRDTQLIWHSQNHAASVSSVAIFWFRYIEYRDIITLGYRGLSLGMLRKKQKKMFSFPSPTQRAKYSFSAKAQKF